MIAYSYFAGCSAKGACRELDDSTQIVARALGIELMELEDAGCTGARQFRAANDELFLTANGRILAMAERAGQDLAVVCDTCLLNLTEARKRLADDHGAREKVNVRLAGEDLVWRGTADVKHFLWIMLEDVGLERLAARVVRPLKGLKVAPFYGCHIRRPSISRAVNGGNRGRALELLTEALGAESVDHAGADKCCGFHGLAEGEDVALRLSGRHLGSAKAGGAQCLVTPCPLCHTVLDAYQPEIERTADRRFGLPIFHAAQLVGLAIGMEPTALGLTRHVVGTASALSGI